MAFVLKPNMPLDMELRRAAKQRLGRAANHLRPPGGRSITDRDVHEARKMLKQARTLVKLVRPAIGEDAYRRDNVTLRDIGRALSEARDRAVLEQLLDRFQARLRRKPGAATALKELRAYLLPTRPGGSGPLAKVAGMTWWVDVTPHAAGAMASDTGADSAMSLRRGRLLAESIEAMQCRIDAWTLKALDWKQMAPAFRRCYRRARKRFRRACRSGDNAVLHESRKRLKDLWYQRRLLRKVWRPKQGLPPKRLDRLTERLGEDHDLAVLDERARAVAPSVGTVGEAGHRQLLDAIADRRRRLQRWIVREGMKLLSGSPKTIEQKLRRAIKGRVPVGTG